MTMVIETTSANSVSKSKNDKKLLAGVRAYASQTDRPTKQGYEDYVRITPGAPSVEDLFQVYGSWRGVCVEMGFRIPRGAAPRGSKEAALTSLRRARRDLGTSFGQRTYDRWAQKHNEVSLTSILRMYKTWSAALEKAGVAATRLRRIEPGPELEEVIRQICSENGGSLSVRDWNTVRPPGVPSAGRIANHYGSWPQALLAAGHVPLYPPRHKAVTSN
jgi:hypothetical protein